LIDLKIIAEKANYLDVMTGIMESLIPTFFMLSMYVSIYFLSSPDQPYQLLQFIICSSQFFAVANNLSLDMASISYSLPGIKRIESLIGEKLEERQYSSHPSSLSNEITFANIHFKYSDATKFILNDISFHIPQGKFIAFIGTSGAGKSSLFKLMLGLEHPSSGEIHVNGEKINLHNINRIRKQVAAVLQTTSLLPGTIFSNISAHNTLTTEEVWDLARCVALDQEVMRMPMKLYTHISDNASESLSGGQRQKILLARALAMKPKILLLDEATSALDNQSQEHIHSYLQTLNITRIVIAHRLSTIVHADKIYVMDHGKIVDFGTYHELLQRGVI
jgi:ABC-type bacteriocin/lantibiotic exporter with double-glycine peptidase domain